MDLNFLFEDSAIPSVRISEKKTPWLFSWFNIRQRRQRRANSNDEINEIHHLILNVYESMDDQSRAVLLSLAKIVQNEEESITIEEKIRAIVDIGHTLACGHGQVKNATQLYTKLLIRALSHSDIRMRLAGLIAIAEASIDNLVFQMKLNEIGILAKLFDLMRSSMPLAGRTLTDINEHSKLVAWSCYAIVNICANCVPNILLLKDMVPTQLDTLQEAIQMEIWCYVWRENYARTIVEFNDQQSVVNAVEPELDIEVSQSRTSSTYHFIDQPTSRNHLRCIIL